MNVAIGLIVALMLGGGTSVSAEQAVPGDLLYPVKTEVNENVRGALTFGTENEAQWNARLAERRLEEAEKLAAEGQLNADVNTRLRTAFQTHAERADQLIEQLEERGDYNRAAGVRSDIQAHLEAHGNVISSIATNIGTSTESQTRTNVEELLSVVRDRAERVAEARVRAETNAEASAHTQSSAEAKIAAAERAISRAQNTLDDLGEDNRAELKTRAQAQLDIAAEDIVSAKAAVESENHARAFSLAQQSQRTATRILVFVRNTNVIGIDGDIGLGIEVSERGEASRPDDAQQQERNEENDRQGSDQSRPDDRGEEDRQDNQRLITAAQTFIAQEANISAERIEVVSVTTQRWSDGCLGLGGPAESCLQAITPGYEITVRIDGELRTYRTNANGSQVRQETDANVDAGAGVDAQIGN